MNDLTGSDVSSLTNKAISIPKLEVKEAERFEFIENEEEEEDEGYWVPVKEGGIEATY
jgi:hypothetical protein